MENANGPCLVLFSGPPGTGKSSLSYRLAQETGWVVAAKDLFDQTLKAQAVDCPPELAYGHQASWGGCQPTLTQLARTVSARRSSSGEMGTRAIGLTPTAGAAPAAPRP